MRKKNGPIKIILFCSCVHVYLFKRKNKRPGEVCSLNQGQSTVLQCFLTHMNEEGDRDKKNHAGMIFILPSFAFYLFFYFFICYFVCLIVCVYLPVVAFFYRKQKKNFFFYMDIFFKVGKSTH